MLSASGPDTAFPDGIDTVDATVVPVRYGEHHLVMAVQDRCSVSGRLERTGSFYELPFLEVLRRCVPDETVIVDVGAHIGNHTLFFGVVMDRPVLAVEANPVTAALLRHNVRRNLRPDRVEVVETAVSDKHGTAQLGRQIADDAGTASLEIAVGAATQTVDVAVTTLDDVWSASHLAGDGVRVGLLKIDVEGHEPAVIRGAKDMLRAHRPLVTTEVQDLPAYREVREEMSQLDYVPVAAMNPTATVFWATNGGVCGELAHAHPILEAALEHAIVVTSQLNTLRQRLTLPIPADGGVPHLIVLGQGLDLADLTGAVRISTVPLTRELGDDPAAPRSRSAISVDVVQAMERYGRPTLVLADYDARHPDVLEPLLRELDAPYVVIERDTRGQAGTGPVVDGARMHLLASELGGPAVADVGRILQDIAAPPDPVDPART